MTESDQAAGRMNVFRLAVILLFHPVEAFDIIKVRRSRFYPLEVFILLILAVVARLCCSLLTHYPLQGTALSDINPLYEAALVLFPLISWTVASYAISSITNGEETFMETLTASAYCMVPYILFKPVMLALSQVLSANAASIYSSLNGIVLAWVVFYLFVAFMRLNDFTLLKAIGIGIVSLILMILMWALLLLFLSLCLQGYHFFENIMTEFNLKYLS